MLDKKRLLSTFLNALCATPSIYRRKKLLFSLDSERGTMCVSVSERNEHDVTNNGRKEARKGTSPGFLEICTGYVNDDT